MPIYLGNKKIDTLSFNNKAIAQAYYGSTLVYENFKPEVYMFNYNGTSQTWTVPRGCTRLLLTCKGANGGRLLKADGTYKSGVPGGMVTCSLSVTPNQTLTFYVGGVGGDTDRTGIHTVSGGFNGGGAGSVDTHMLFLGGAGGGGATDIRIGGTALANRVVVAGGAGGSSIMSGASDDSSIWSGGFGGGLVGGDAEIISNVTNAKGGTQSAGGAGATYRQVRGGTGALGVGGDAGVGEGGIAAGGGGGGYYGGGGGVQDTPGAGGSSYASSTLCTDVLHTPGDRFFAEHYTTNGFINIITANDNPVPFYYYEYGGAMVGILSPKKITQTGTYSFYSEEYTDDDTFVARCWFTVTVTDVLRDSSGRITDLLTTEFGDINARMADTPSGYWE